MIELAILIIFYTVVVGLVYFCIIKKKKKKSLTLTLNEEHLAEVDSNKSILKNSEHKAELSPIEKKLNTDKSFAGFMGSYYSIDVSNNSNTPEISHLNKNNEKSIQLVHGLNGLRNIGNTCFMNSGLQSLNNIKELREFFLQSSRSIRMGKLTYYFQNILKKLWFGEVKVTPFEFKKTFFELATSFSDYNQEDSFEFINCLLEILHDELKNEEFAGNLDNKIFQTIISNSIKTYKNFKAQGYFIVEHSSKLSIISDLFHILAYIKVNCLECGYYFLKYDPPMSSISLPIPNITVIGNQSAYATLNDCFELMTKKMNSAKADYFCSKCKTKTMSTMQYSFWNLPKVLLLQLNRFTFDSSGRMKKNNQIVECPLELNLKDLCKNNYEMDYNYELVSIINHYGSYKGGHYNCYAKNSENNLWYCFDDSRVSKLNENRFSTKNAYVLTYSLKIDLEALNSLN